MTNSANIVALTHSDFVTPQTDGAIRLLASRGIQVLPFRAEGTGGREMERQLLDGRLQGVLDLTTAELAAELLGGPHGAGRDRLTAAAIRGVPQVIGVGGLDAVWFDDVPEKYRDRVVRPNWVRTTAAERDRLGKEIAEKACAARGSTAILLPLRGLSAWDDDLTASHTLFQSLRNWVYGVELIELDLHVTDPAFITAAADKLLAMMRTGA